MPAVVRSGTMGGKVGIILVNVASNQEQSYSADIIIRELYVLPLEPVFVKAPAWTSHVRLLKLPRRQQRCDTLCLCAVRMC
jgi:hypothetical protein